MADPGVRLRLPARGKVFRPQAKAKLTEGSAEEGYAVWATLMLFTSVSEF